MTPLPRPPIPHVTPLPSFCVVPTRRTPGFGEMLKSIVVWLRGGERPTKRELFLEQRVVERLAAELEAADAARAAAEPSVSVPKVKAKRAGR
jgi:hypothetical protein